ncbi:MAG: hypothetical protein HKN73_08220 [Gemmatimonadetes bacterium]|nr:hypothetical protein [Gemmatimonadota bacterium]
MCLFLAWGWAGLPPLLGRENTPGINPETLARANVLDKALEGMGWTAVRAPGGPNSHLSHTIS